MKITDPRAIPLLLLIMFAFSCGTGGDSAEEGDDGLADTLENAVQQDRQVVKVGGKLFGIPSPAQAMLLIKRSGTGYRQDLTLALDLATKQTTRSTRSLALGAYGADLAYATAFQDGQKALNTLKALEKLGAELGLNAAFDKSLLDKFKANLTQEDSLLRLSGSAFRAADEYLKSDKQEDASSLILTGGWIESMHLTLAGFENGLPLPLKERVGQQQRTVQGLISLLGQRSDLEGVQPLLDGLNKLNTVYGGITMTYHFEQPETNAAARTTYIKSTSSVTITDDQIRSIAEHVSALRAQIKA